MLLRSPRVLGVAGYSEAAARAAFVRSQLQQPLLHGPQGQEPLLMLGSQDLHEPAPYKFCA